MRCVTSFGPEGYERYGRTFLETYIEHIGLPIDVYYEEQPDFEHELITYHDLFKTEGCVQFLQMASFPAARGQIWGEGYNYNFDTYKFSRKAFAQIDAASNGPDLLFWLDSDIEFKAPLVFPQDFEFMAYLGRPEWHSCTSFIGFNLNHEIAGEFFKRYWLMYVTGTIFCLEGWTDCHVLDWLRAQARVPAKNLAEGMDLQGPANVFDAVFGESGHHKKGNLKKHKNRYQELIEIVQKRKPERILEIGTWNGNRAIELCQFGASYVGFDLFETASDETDEIEKNVKAHNSLEDVSERLKAANVNAHLIEGNTRLTLPTYTGEPFDLAFIDGGHSVETIQSDWQAVRKLMKPGGLVVFDDYYEGMSEEDLDKWGANRVLEATLEFTLSDSRDPVVGGGVTRLAYVEV